METRNKYKLLAVLLLSFFLLISLALAAVEFQENVVTLDVDYGDLVDDDEFDINGQFTLTNTDVNETTVKVSFSGFPNGYDPVNVNDVTITGNGTATVSFTIEVPHDQDAGERNIGEIIISDTNDNELDRLTLRQETKSMIILNKFKVYYTNEDGDSEKDNFDGQDEDFELDENVRSGTKVTFIFEIENLFDDDYDDGELEDIKLIIEVDDNDLYKDDFEEEYDLDNLGASDESEFTVSFTIDDEADSNDYSFEISLEAEDGKGAKHTYQGELTFNVEKVKDDLRIINLEITPEKITTCSEKLNIEVNLKNFGTANQRDVRLGVYSSRFGIDENVAGISIDRNSKINNEFQKKFQFSLDKDLTPGLYPVDFTVYIDDDKQIDYERLFIGVEECADLPEVVEEIVVMEEEKIPEINKISSATIVSTVENPYTSDDLLIAMLIVAIVVILAAIVSFSIILFKK